ncbi:MAG: pseudouridine synthase, partial [Mobilitalea sp.]
MAQQLRLDRFLSDMEIGTRSDIKVWIRNGRAKVNGEVVTKPETKVVIPTDEVTFDETRIKYATYVYYMLHKPMGVVSARVDNVNETVIDLLDDSVQRKDLSPVGRLDKDTEGLLIITNDGELSHQLLSPRKHVDKVYFARVHGNVTVE